MSQNGAIPEGVPRASLELGGKERTAVFTMGTMIRLKRAMGLDLEAAFERLQRQDIEDVPVLLWAMIAHGEDADLSPEAVADMISFDQIGAVSAAIGRLVVASQPEAKEVPEGEAKARRTKKATK